MRLWSIHPKYLDSKGLVALWREALLAQRVLDGKTTGYKNHPQLERFKKRKNPLAAIGTYLFFVGEEAAKRHYRFDTSKILQPRTRNSTMISVTSHQLKFETRHLLNKLKTRDPERYEQLFRKKSLLPHPIFYTRPGALEEWEKGSLE